MKIDQSTRDVVRDIARRVTGVKIPVGRMKTHQRLPGDRRSIHRGEGDDFDGHDVYAYGDDPRTIDWNASAMTGGQQILVALFKEEAHLRSTILTDVSPSMNFGSTRASKRVLAAELAACAVRSLAMSHDPVALVTYSKWGIERRIKSGSSASMMLPVIAHTLDSSHKVRPAKHSGLAKGLGLVPRSPSIVFVISDFINMSEADFDALRRAGQRHNVFAFVVQDLREREYPQVGFLPYLYTLEDANGLRRDILVTKASARKFAEAASKRNQELLEKLKACRAQAMLIGTEEGEKSTASVLSFLQSSLKR